MSSIWPNAVFTVAGSPEFAGFREDFLGFPDTVTSYSAEMLIQGDTSWNLIPINGASGGGLGNVQVGSTDTFKNPGVGYFQTPATSGQGVAVWKSTWGGNSCGTIGLNAGWEANIILALQSTSNICIRAGFGYNGMSGDPPSDGMWVRYDTGAGDTNFTWETRQTSTSTVSTTNSIAADIATFHHFKIRSVTAGTILFSVDGGTETAISTNVSSAKAVKPFWQVITRSNTNQTIYIDFFSYMAATGRT